MPDRRFTWEAIIDTRTAIRSINELADAMKRTLNSSGANKVEIIDRASLETAKQQARAAASEVIESQRRMTVETRTQGQERAAAARAEAGVISEAAKAASQTRIEQERRSTALLKAELAEQSRAIRESQKAASSGGGLQNAVLGGIAGFLTVQGARQIFSYAQQIATLDTNVSRATKAFDIMSGSAAEAEKRLRAIVSASGGTVDNFQAIQIANQATSLGLAKTSAEFENLTRAARAVTFVSPVIHDVQSAITELALASANLSYRRLDQLGLSVTEVRDRVNELMSANSGLDESQAFLQASVDALNSKFGTLLDSTEAQASGVERLRTSWANFTQDVASSKLGEAFNAIFTDAAKQMERFGAFISGDNSAFGNIGSLNGLIGDIQKRGPTSAFASSLPDLENLKSIFQEINQLAEAGVPGIDSFAERVSILTANVVQTGYVTAEASAEISQFQNIVAAVSSVLDESSQAGKFYADAVKIAGEETVQTDEKTAALVGQMINLNAQQAAGVISASDYAAQIAIVGNQLIGMASQAAIAATELENVNYQTQVMLAAANNKLFFGSGGTRGTRPIGPLTMQQATSLATDTSINPFTREAQFASQQDYQEQLAKEREKAEREAAAAAKRAAKEGERLYNQAQTELRNSIAAIVKVSQVTQQDIEDAKNGIYKEKPDEYLRRLRDEVKNGKNYDDVSVEEAADGLNKIGVETAGKSAEAILSLFEQAFSNMSLFADKENLKFLNDGAVEKQLKLKELAKQGQDNVFEHYGAVVGQAVQAALGGGGGSVGGATGTSGATPATPATINVGGKGIAGQGIEISATVTKITVADDAAKDIAPKLTFNSDSIVFTGDDAQAARDRLAKQLTPTLDLGAPGQGFYLGADAAKKIKQGLADAITPTLTLSTSSFVLGGEDAALISANLSTMIAPVFKPTLGDPDMQEVTRLQQRITSLLNSEEAANPTVASGGLGGVLNNNGQKSKANPLATRYVSDLVASFNDTEVTLPLLGVGSFVLGVIDSGFDLAKTTSTIGTDIIMGINEQVFSEQNVAMQKTIGNNIYQLILAGIRVAMKAKNNNVGQEIVDNIAAQVVEATVGAVQEAP